MTITATQSGFTDASGDVTKIVDGDTSTGWSVVPYSDGLSGRAITVDMGGWFDGSLLTNIDRYTSGFAQTRADRFAIQLSADGVDWYNTGGVYLMGATGWGPLTPGWAGFTVPAWPRAEYFRYVRFVSTDGVYTPNGGPLVLDEMRFCINTTGTPITIDTSGGANPAPPTGTPDPSPPTPGDSGVETRFSSVVAQVMRVDNSDARVSSAFAQVMRVDNSDARISAVFLQVMVKAPKLLHIDFTDDARFRATTNLVPWAGLAADFADDSVFTAKMKLTPALKAQFIDDSVFTAKTNFLPTTIAVDFTDDATFTANLDVIPIVFPQWSSYITGRG